MRFLSLCLCVLIGTTSNLLAADKEQLRGIKGQDDRVLVEDYKYPWSAIGRLNKEVGGFCTGTLIAPKLVLTAAHCLWNKKRKVWLKPHTIHFLAGYRRGSFIDHSVASKFYISPSYDPKNGSRLSAAAKDWAVLELKNDMSDKVGTIALEAAGRKRFGQLHKQKTKFVQAGYSQDKSHILSINKGCSFRGYSKKYNVIVHDCDAVNGDSGSPIFYQTNGIPKIASIHVATTRKGKSEGIAVSGASIANHLKKEGLWARITQSQKPTVSN